ncbi:MAG: glutaredoxin family protein [Chloroflexi bacterium]|nr:glutaredoxin family protein [Chloroflexota bacterium]
MIHVTLYTKPGCCLCEHARDDLDALAEAFPMRVNELNILDDAALFNRYQHLIPVVVIGQSRLVYPFHELDLQVALEAASPLETPHDS